MMTAKPKAPIFFIEDGELI